jgi:AcrR family transcriptional regulator
MLGHSYPVATVNKVNAMPRPLDYRVRAKILCDTVDYIDIDGLANVSLRPLGIATSVSPRMLIHYFGTKEELLRQALASVRPDFTALFAPVADLGSLACALRVLWASTTGGEHALGCRVLLQVLGVACVPGPYTAYAAEVVRGHHATLRDAFARAGVAVDTADERATLLTASFRGLLTDRLLSGDTSRTDAAAEAAIRDALR